MKVFYFMGNNSRNKSGVSWKIWKIQRIGRAVTTNWGSATIKKRVSIASGKLHNMERRFDSPEDARVYEQQRISSKLRKGYERKARKHL